MLDYSFDTILVNKREVKLKDIIDGNEKPLGDYEGSAFAFMQQWFNGTKTFIQATSGSTGPPKKITIRKDQMIASALLTKQALGLNAGDTSFICLDTAYIAGKMMLARSFVVNMKIVLVNPRLNPFAGIYEMNFDFTALVPLQLVEILQSVDSGWLHSIKSILVGGATLNQEAQKLMSNFSNFIYETYGMTETISHIALRRVNGPARSDYFTVLPGIKISSDDRKCLVVEAPFLDEAVVTNDIVEIKDGKAFKWLGRVDNVINTGGVKVSPEKIEVEIHKVFEDIGLKNKFIISSTPEIRLSNRLILLIEGDVDSASISTLKLYLKRTLRPYENPKEVYTNIDFVLTPTGKINRTESVRRLSL